MVPTPTNPLTSYPKRRRKDTREDGGRRVTQKKNSVSLSKLSRMDEEEFIGNAIGGKSRRKIKCVRIVWVALLVFASAGALLLFPPERDAEKTEPVNELAADMERMFDEIDIGDENEFFAPSASLLGAANSPWSGRGLPKFTLENGFGAWTVPVRGIISSPFGWRRHPITARRNFHTGVDIAAATGTPVLAAKSGVVEYSGWMTNYGKTIVIRHENDYSTLYAHCNSIFVKKGDEVAKGTPVGTVGDTGRTTGPHLHFEIRAGKSPVDPLTEIPARSAETRSGKTEKIQEKRRT